MIEELSHGFVPRPDVFGADERAQQPVAQQACTHACQGFVENLDERARASARSDVDTQRLEQLEVATRHLIERHPLALPVHAGCAQRRERARLHFRNVGNQRAQRADQRGVVRLKAETVQRQHLVTPFQLLRGNVVIEQPVCTVRAHGGRIEGHVDERLRQQQLGRLEARQLRLEGSAVQQHRGDFAGRCIARALQRHQVIVALLGEQRIGKDCARRDGLDHLPADESLGFGRIFHLLADRDAPAQAQQPLEILVAGPHRHARQRHIGGAAVVARSERQPQQARALLGVFTEHLVEIADPEKDERVRMA